MFIRRVISGGQIGADQGGLIAAAKLKIPTGGIAPVDFATAQGKNDFLLGFKFGLIAYDGSYKKWPAYEERTYANVEMGDGTIRFATNFDSPGEITTKKAITKFKKPHFDIDLRSHIDIDKCAVWIIKNNIRVLNVAGNRHDPKIDVQEKTEEILTKIILAVEKKVRQAMIWIFYHRSDLDGKCAGAIVNFKHMYQSHKKLYPIDYDLEFPLEEIREDDTVYMVDFTLQPFTRMVELRSKCNLIWIDHHESEIKEHAKWEKERGNLPINGVRNKDYAGCELTWNYLFPDEAMPKVVYLLGRYDVWDHEADSDVLPFQYGMRMESSTDPENISWWKSMFINDWVTGYINNGRNIITYQKQQDRDYVKAYAFKAKIKGFPEHTAWCVNRAKCGSMTFESLDMEGIDLFVSYIHLPDGRYTVSFYQARKDMDVSTIAKSFGGGGHTGAAGCQVDDIETVIERV